MEQILKIAMLFCVFILAVSPCLAQDEEDAKKPTRKERRKAADSLRMEMRHAADEGRLLLWGDSLLRARQSQGTMSKAKYERLRKRLYRYGKRLHRGDSLLTSRFFKANVDTSYIIRPRGVRWTVKVRENVSGTASGA